MATESELLSAAGRAIAQRRWASTTPEQIQVQRDKARRTGAVNLARHLEAGALADLVEEIVRAAPSASPDVVARVGAILREAVQS